jgi:5-formyltetrahydrofolate cyclo-ligase
MTQSETSAARAALRRTLRERRAALPAAQRVAAAQALVVQLERIPEFLTDSRLAGYWAVGGELPLAAAMAGAASRGQHWYLPVLADGDVLRFARWRSGEAIQPNRYGIPEPVDSAMVAADELDLVLLPLVAFDRLGNRLGMGAGWYDRSLAFLHGRTGLSRPVLVGVGYAVQEVPRVPVEPWDVRLDYIATERELIDLAGEP